jgi:hypothetical protein
MEQRRCCLSCVQPRQAGPHARRGGHAPAQAVCCAAPGVLGRGELEPDARGLAAVPDGVPSERGRLSGVMTSIEMTRRWA